MKYKPRLIWSGFITGCFIVMVSVAIPGFLSNPILWRNPWSYVAFLIAIIMPLHALFGMYIVFDNSKVCRVDFFFLRDCIAIKDIQNIVYQASFVFGGHNKTVSVFDAKGNKVFMESMPFGFKLQKSFIENLIRLNPSIRLNEEAQELLKIHLD